MLGEGEKARWKHHSVLSAALILICEPHLYVEGKINNHLNCPGFQVENVLTDCTRDMVGKTLFNAV